MTPSQISPQEFRDYPPLARQVAVSHLELLRRLPLALAPLLLVQIQQYDWSFPAERRTINAQLSYLASLPSERISQVVAGFKQITLSSKLEKLDWVESPRQFSDQLSSFLWSSGQQDHFTAVANQFIRQVDASRPAQRLPIPRLGIAIIGKGAGTGEIPLFRKLRPYGTYFTAIDPANGLGVLTDLVSARARKAPVPFAHWHIDGARVTISESDSLKNLSYTALQPVRSALLEKIGSAIKGGIGGPEALNRMLRAMRPEEIGLPGGPGNEVLSRFIANIFTNGQGTQIFSTTFVQWTARELWRRAQPLTILARFTPRQRQRPMNELLSGEDANPQPDPAGSLIDADMGAYLMWIEQQRLAESEQALFVAWFEDHREALVISPYLPHNTESNEAGDMNWLLRQAGLV